MGGKKEGGGGKGDQNTHTDSSVEEGEGEGEGKGVLLFFSFFCVFDACWLSCMGGEGVCSLCRRRRRHT